MTSSARCGAAIDMFDCVIPTRAGRTARAYTSRGVFNLRNARSPTTAPLDADCACPRLHAPFSRAYLHHLFKAEEMLGPMLLTWHNLTYYQDLMRGLRPPSPAAGWPRRPRLARRLGGGGDDMTDENYAGLTQLGRATNCPPIPTPRMLERVPNPSRGRTYVVRFTCPNSPRCARSPASRISPTSSSTTSPRDWIVESKSLKLYLGCVPQPRRVPRGLHDGDRQALIAAARPQWLRIGGYWYPRGGMPIDVF